MAPDFKGHSTKTGLESELYICRLYAEARNEKSDRDVGVDFVGVFAAHGRAQTTGKYCCEGYVFFGRRTSTPGTSVGGVGGDMVWKPTTPATGLKPLKT